MSADNDPSRKWFNEKWLKRIDKNVEDSTGLPNALYTNPEFLQFENEQLFPSVWILAGFVHQVPNVGDVAPITVAEKPLILLHNENDEILVFHNVCRHRGGKLVSSACTEIKVLVCPNHSWTYGLDGKIRARPHFFGWCF